MNFRSVAQLNDQVLAWSHALPRDIEVVVGVPRSGMLPASLLSRYRNVPLADVEGLLAGRCLDAGPGATLLGRDRRPGPAEMLSTPRRVLVVDDSVFHGGAMGEVRARVDGARLPHRVSYGAVYVRPAATSAVDFFHEVLPTPRFFEWNAFKHPVLAESCIDLDVLCHDQVGGDLVDDGGRAHLLRDAAPRHVPSREVRWIVTSRPERHRAVTEAWLDDHGIAYGELVMWDQRHSTRARRASSAWTAAVYRGTEAQMCFVNSTQQAMEVCELAGKDVLAVDAMHLSRPGRRPLVHGRRHARGAWRGGVSGLGEDDAMLRWTPSTVTTSTPGSSATPRRFRS